jgi:hypothetical protein
VCGAARCLCDSLRWKALAFFAFQSRDDAMESAMVR